MAEPKIKYDIEAAVKGEADANELAKALRGVGDVLEGDLQQSARDAATALDALAAKQKALSSFTELRRESQELASSLDKATQVVDRLANELPQATAQTAAMARAQQEASAAVTEISAELERKRKALAQLREETKGAARRTTEFKDAEVGLKAGIAATKAELKTRQAALREANTATAKAQQAEAALKREYELSLGAAARASAEVRNKNQAVESSRKALQDAGISTNNLAQAERNLQGAVRQVRQEVAALAPAYQQAAAASTASTQVQAQNQRTLREGMTSISTQLQRIQQIATIALGGSWVGGMIKDVAATADEFKNLQARVALAAGEGESFKSAWEGVTRVALDTNTALDQTGTLFARLDKAAKEGGNSAVEAQRRALGLTETINQAVQLSGGSAASANAAITQLIQGLQSGVLRGEEFNSVMEQAPRLAQALANGLGVTTGELRKMAQQGQLTADVVMKALEGQADTVATEFGKLPSTVGRALQNLQTQWTLYIGSSDAGIVSTENASKVINALAQNLDLVVTGLTSAGKAWAALKIGALAADFGRWAAQTLTATKAVEGNTVATVANTAAQRANAAAQAQVTANQAAATAAINAHAAAQARHAEITKSLSIFAGQAQRATEAATAAGVAADQVAVKQAASVGLLGRGLATVAGVLGGPVGVTALLAMFHGEIKTGIVGVTEWIASFTPAGQRLREVEKQIRATEEAEKAANEVRLQAAEALKRQAAAAEEARNKQFGLSKEAVVTVKQFDELRAKGDSASAAIEAIGKDFDLSTVPGIANAAAVLDKLLADGKITAEQFRLAWGKALEGQDLAKFEVNAKNAFKGSAREAERLAQGMDAGVREAVKRTGLEFEVLQGQIGKSARAAINDVQFIIDNLGQLKSEGVDTGRVLSASLTKAIETADSQQALDAVRSQIEQVRTALGQKLADGLLVQAATKAQDLRNKLDDVTPGINSVTEAMRRLGITTDATLKKTAGDAKSAYDLLVGSGKASARELAAAFEKAAGDAIAANNGIAPAWVKSAASVRGFEVAVDSAGKTTLRSMREGVNAANAMGQGLDQVSSKAQALERQMSSLEQRNASVKSSLVTDKDGFAADEKGNRIVAGSDVSTRTGIFNFLKAAGVSDDAAARRITNEFADAKGEITYFNNPGQKKYRGTTMTEALLRAAEQYTFDGQGAAPAPAPGTGGPAPSPSAPNYTTNIYLGNRLFPIRTADQDSADQLSILFRELERQRGVAQ